MSKRKSAEFNLPLVLDVNRCKSGERYRVSGYHTGNFLGEFVRLTGKRTGEFKIIKHGDPEQVGKVVDIPHHLASIEFLVSSFGVDVENVEGQSQP